MITIIFFLGGGGWGGSFYTSNILDRTLGSLGQVGFPAGQVPLKITCQMGKGLGKSSHNFLTSSDNFTDETSKTWPWPGKQNARAACP